MQCCAIEDIPALDNPRLCPLLSLLRMEGAEESEGVS